MIETICKALSKFVYVLPLFFPLYLVKLELVGFPFNVLEILVVCLFVFRIFFEFVRWIKSRRVNCALHSILSPLSSQNFEKIQSKVEINNFCRFFERKRFCKFFQQNRKFLIVSFLFLLISTISTFIVPKETLLIDGETVYRSRQIAFGILKGWIVIPWLWFAMLWFNTHDKQNLFTMFYAYVFSALPLVIWAFYQYLNVDFITLDGRASGPFVNANYLAMYLAPAVTGLWIMIVRGVLLGFNPIRFLVGAFLAMFYSITMLMTQSYGAMLAVIVTLIVFMIFTFTLHSKERKEEQIDILKKIAAFLTVIALIAIMSAVLLFANTEKWKVFTEFTERSSSSVRLQIYQIALDFVRQSPVLGIGFGQFEPRYNLEAPEILGKAPYEWVVLHPHNTFLAIWLNMGIAGVILFVWLVFSICRKAFFKSEYEEKFFRMIGTMLLLVLLLHGTFDTYLFKNDLAMQFWMIVALCVLPRQKKVLQSE